MAHIIKIEDYRAGQLRTNQTGETVETLTNTVIQGDCLDIMRTLPDGSIDAVITDPPYGINYSSKALGGIANDKRPFIWWLHDAHRLVKDGGALLCFCEWRYQHIFRMAIETAGFTVKSQVIWDRKWHGMGDTKAAFAPTHDLIWFAVKGKFAFPNGRPKDVIQAEKLSSHDLTHPNEKPLKLMRELITAVTPAGGLVLDPFAGSGSTLCAAEAEGRDYIGIELEHKYVQLAQSRLQSRDQEHVDGLAAA